MNPILQTLIRAALKVGGGYLDAKGLASDNDAQVIVAGLMALIGVVWGILHRTPSPAPPPTPQPQPPISGQ